MSIHLMTSAWRLDMPASKKLVLLALCDWANDDGASLHPSIARIAERGSMSERNAQRVVHSLIDEGWLDVVGNHNGGKPGSSRQYQLNVSAIYSGRPPAQTGDKLSSHKNEGARGDKLSRVTDAETGDAHVRGDKLSRVTDAETGDAHVRGDKLSRVTNDDENRGGRVTPRDETGDTGVTLTVIDPPIKATVMEREKENARASVSGIANEAASQDCGTVAQRGGMTPAAELATGIRRVLGPACGVSSAHPDVIAAAVEGVTAAEVLEIHESYPDKSVLYAVAVARSYRSREPKTLVVVPSQRGLVTSGHAGYQPTSKRAAALLTLEAMKG
ncbi:hypothetical protein CO610_07370 [Lysobacteraceae bacterium NML95-0200]|nr:hypothetical protein CO610_07370 [Xanthomonadaceae bacterium NML95-0200]